MYNKIILIGNLTRDVEIRYTPSGTAVAKFGLATNRTYVDPSTKEKRQEAMFIDITVFGRAAETANQYLRKGSQVLVEGRLTLNQWTDQNTGQKRSKHEIVAETIKFLGTHDNAQTQQPQQSGGQNTTNNQSTQSTADDSKTENSGNVNETNSNVPNLNLGEEEIPF